MTVLEAPSTNGNAREAAYQEYVAAGGRWTIAQVAEATGLKDRQAGTLSRQWKERLAANGGSSASGVLPPPSPAPRAIDTQRPRTATQSRASDPTRNGAGGVRGKRTRGKARDPVRIALAAVVAAVMAAVSYHHIVELAILAGAGWPAWVLPLALDGMVALSIRCLVVDGLRDPVAWLGLGLGFAGSAAANVYAYRPDLIDLDQAIIVIGLSPAVSFLIAGWLLERGATR